VHAVRKYLAQRAEPEAKLAAHFDGVYERCLVVPACRERASLLDGFSRAAVTSSGRTLCILVVNVRENASTEEHAASDAFLAELATLRGARAVSPSRDGAFDVLVVDRASEGRRFPPKSGVGLARKVGMDVALALHAAGKVRARMIHSTDADATLPDAHFERPELASGAGAVVFPFWHEPSVDLAVTRATALYELSLRYYVAGLAFARSPYAYHSLGSTMAVDVESYAAVRGVPDREAGEDFYLLGKVAKVAPLVRATIPALALQSRASDRTPFGTGAGVAEGLDEPDRAFYAPETFVALGRWLDALDVLADTGSVERFDAERGGLAVHEWDAARAALLGQRGRDSFTHAVRDALSPSARRVRVHEWFDAFRTLKFVHALRDAVHVSVPFRDALARAPFSPLVGDDVDACRRAFADAESTTPAVFGPRQPRGG
jgi:hypothetical protein